MQGSGVVAHIIVYVALVKPCVDEARVQFDSLVQVCHCVCRRGAQRVLLVGCSRARQRVLDSGAGQVGGGELRVHLDSLVQVGECAVIVLEQRVHHSAPEVVYRAGVARAYY